MSATAQTITIPLPDGTSASVQVAAATGGFVLLVSGPSLVGTNGTTVVTQQPGTGVPGGPNLPGFGIYVGPVQYALAALQPYLPF